MKTSKKKLGTIILTVYLSIAVIYCTIVTFSGCKTIEPITNKPGTPEDWQRFEKCIESHPSDYVCDSCYFAIFGIH